LDKEEAMTQLINLGAAIALAFTICSPAAAARKPKPLVQDGLSSGASTAAPTAVFYTAFLILPDGTHALAMCAEALTTPCSIEPVPIEKRVKVTCDLVEDEDAKVYHPTCYQSESYEAVSKNNDITLRTARWKVTYSIFKSW